MRARREDDFPDYREPPDEFREMVPPRPLPHIVFVLMLLVGSLAAVHYFGGPLIFERVSHALIAPAGLTWLVLSIALYWVLIWRIRMAIFLCGIAWLILTVGGNSWVSNRLIGSLETPYSNVEPFQNDKLEVLIVLGGGTDTAPNGVAQLGPTGDRLILAARLYHAGKVKRIIVSGVRPVPLQAHQRHYFEESSVILKGLNVPAEHIVELPAGSDTSGELRALEEWIGDQSLGPIGVLTSAWHMKRAILLAKRLEINVRPIPANFLSQPDRFDVAQIIPTAWSLQASKLAIKEWLGRWLDR